MFTRLKESLATLIEMIRTPRDIREDYARPASSLKFRFRYSGNFYDVTVYCNERVYLCSYTGWLRYSHKFPIYEVYSVIGGAHGHTALQHVFDMTIFFPAIGNRLCTPKQQASIAIDAYISVITQRFKSYIDAGRSNAA